MSIKISTTLLFFMLLTHNTFAQIGKNEIGIYNSYLNNVKDSNLTTGLYIVNIKELNYKDYEHYIKNKQIIKDVEEKKLFWFLKQRRKVHYIHSISYSTKIVKDKFTHNIPGNDTYYQINPFPIALKNNIIRIYDYNRMKSDSTNNLLSITIKLDFCADFNLYDDYNNYNGTLIGLVVNNQLISVSNNYIKEELNDQNRRFDRYLVFNLPKQISDNLDYYKKILHKQTLFRK